MEKTEVKKSASTLLKEKISVWKKKYGRIFLIEVEDKKAYLKRPDRKALSAAAVVGGKDPMKYNEVLLNSCWIEGDEELRTDDSYFLAVSAKLAELIEIKEAELKEL